MCPQSEVYKNKALDYYCWHALILRLCVEEVYLYRKLLLRTEIWNVRMCAQAVCESPKVSDSLVSLARQWFALITNQPNTVRV